MTRKTTTHRKPRTFMRALAALAVVLGAGLVSAAPARADHDGPDVGFHFFFGLPFPPIPVFPVPVYEPPRYYEPRVVYEERPVYYAPRAYYRGRPHGYWRGDDRHGRGARDGGWHDRRGRDWDRD
jgi:hypothetical protein